MNQQKLFGEMAVCIPSVKVKTEIPKTRSDRMFLAFVNFHVVNPNVWLMFKQFTWEAILAGRKLYSSDAICHRIRWEAEVATKDCHNFKIPNNYTAYYARLFHAAFPAHTGFFLTKPQKTKHSDESYVERTLRQIA